MNALSSIFSAWGGREEFLKSQAFMIAILGIAWFGDNWEPSYPRNDNHNMQMYYVVHIILFALAAITWTHKPRGSTATSKGPSNEEYEKITLLSRSQTEEWKGWMQFAFIMYHYYRAWSAYNWIRVFVSSYVWMTGFGNFLYFDKTKDYSIARIVSMCIRINYFPMLLAWATGVTLDLYYVVPLHTEGFFMTMITCRLYHYLEDAYHMSYYKARIIAIGISFLAHVLFYETSAVNFLLFFSEEIHLRFQIDKYSAWVGIVCGLLMKHLTDYMTWAYGSVVHGDRLVPQWVQRFGGVILIAFWYHVFGFLSDKLVYNPIHPYVFWLPIIGWLMIRNSSRYLTECHSTLLEFVGKNTLETYVLQFHLFMNHSVQNIPIVIPGSGPPVVDGNDPNIVLEADNPLLRFLNMLFCGFIFCYVAIYARKFTISTQNTTVELVKMIQEPNEYMPASTSEETTDLKGHVVETAVVLSDIKTETPDKV